jgi:PilZ domain
MAKTSQEELRRAPRVRVCCRVDVRQPHGVWSAVTDDLSARGCRIVTPQLPRLGSRLPLTLSSDLFADELATLGEVVWVSGEQLGVLFVEEARRSGSMSPAEWLRKVLTCGKPPDPGGASQGAVVPVVSSVRRRGSPISIRSRRRSG